MRQKFPKAGLRKLFLLDFHFRMFTIFFIISLLPVLFGIYFLAITFVLNIATLLVCLYRYNYINNCLKYGEVIKGKIFKILRQLRKSHYIEINELNNEKMEGLYVLEVSYTVNSEEYDVKTPITYLRNMGNFYVDQEIEILVNPKKPKRYIVKSIWVPPDYISIS
jgi:hypothetical protein